MNFDENLSRKLSAILRYEAPRQGLYINTDGWVKLVDVTLQLQREEHEIALVVKHSYQRGKPRFELQAHTGVKLIRATWKRGVQMLQPAAISAEGIFAQPILGQAVPSAPCAMNFDENLSRKLSAILRYEAPRQGLYINTDGWVKLVDVTCQLQREEHEIALVVEHSYQRGKPRFELQAHMGVVCIRATWKRRVQMPLPSQPAGSPTDDAIESKVT